MTKYLEAEIQHGSIQWYSTTFDFPSGICVCDALYHSGFHLESITSVCNLGVLGDRNENTACVIISSVKEDPSELKYMNWAAGGCGSQILLDGAIIDNTDSDTVTNHFYNSKAYKIEGIEDSIFSTKTIRGKSAILIETHTGTGGFGLYKHSKGYILDFIGYHDMSEDDYEDYIL